MKQDLNTPFLSWYFLGPKNFNSRGRQLIQRVFLSGSHYNGQSILFLQNRRPLLALKMISSESIADCDGTQQGTQKWHCKLCIFLINKQNEAGIFSARYKTVSHVQLKKQYVR